MLGYCCAISPAETITSEAIPGKRMSIDEIAAQSVLAECRVQTKPPKPAPAAMPEQVVFRMSTELPDDPLENYARSRNGEWQIHTHSSLKDPWVRCLMLTPERPVVVELAVLVDSKSFREVRQRWVELLLSQAKGNYSAPGESSEPAAQTEKAESKLSEKKEPPEGTASTAVSSEEQSSNATAIDKPLKSPAGDNVREAIAKASDAIEQVAESAEEMMEAAEAITGVDIQRRTAPSVIKRLKNYVAAMGDDVDAEEIRWLIADWAGGPGLLVLGPGAAWERAEIAPLWSWLDEDYDHRLSPAEIANARQRLAQADINEDDIVDVVEFYRSSSMRSPYVRTHAHPLVVVLDEETDWNVLSDDLEDAYGENPLSTNPDQLSKLLSQAPELRYIVSLEKEGKVGVLSYSSSGNGPAPTFEANNEIVTVNMGGMYFELSAAYEAPNSEEISSPQIAIGAAIDGYPLLRLLDTNGDDRVTLPEARKLDALLERLDINHDGSIGQSELPTAVRLTVSNGPFAHELFEKRAAAAQLPAQEVAEVPDWFKNMDRNRDGELSRREFPGSPQQFAAYDLDGNGIISGTEIQESSAANE